MGASRSGPGPMISVIMANYEGAAFLGAALESVLSQTVRDIEVIVSDDASADDSLAVVRRFIEGDARVSLIANERNGGPGAARNRALAAARGEWVAIVDSDDILHPERFECLLAAAEKHEADAVADDLLFFSETGAAGTLLGESANGQAEQITARHFIRSNTSGSGLPPLGYLKPMIRRDRLDGLTYDEAVRIGEDYDFLLRFLLAGGRLVVLPELLYLYRRHSGSISHRLSESAVRAMIANQQALQARYPALPAEVAHLLDRRMAALQRALSFERLVAALKERRAAGAVRILAADPRLFLPLARSAVDGLQSRLKREAGPPEHARMIALHGGRHGPEDLHSIHSVLGLARPTEVHSVPPYAPPGLRVSATGQARALRERLAGLAMRPGVSFVCHGMAGLHEVGFFPRKPVAAVIIEDAAELAPALEWLPAIPGRLIVSEDALKAAPPRLRAQSLCPGYHLLEREEPDARAEIRTEQGAGAL
jgi:succinoglycan biosynthesis protein ExoO